MKKIVYQKCPNPYCDDEEGCCVCEYTGFFTVNEELGECILDKDDSLDLLSNEQYESAKNRGLIPY